VRGEAHGPAESCVTLVLVGIEHVIDASTKVAYRLGDFPRQVAQEFLRCVVLSYEPVTPYAPSVLIVGGQPPLSRYPKRNLGEEVVLTSEVSAADRLRCERTKAMSRQGVVGVDPVFSRKGYRRRGVVANSLRLTDIAPTSNQVPAFIRARAPNRAA
jgi:hypothetical protein